MLFQHVNRSNSRVGKLGNHWIIRLTLTGMSRKAALLATSQRPRPFPSALLVLGLTYGTAAAYQDWKVLQHDSTCFSSRTLMRKWHSHREGGNDVDSSPS
ncbi:hypothetical protein V2G26_008755 [Clonostachys chloroleuca]